MKKFIVYYNNLINIINVSGNKSNTRGEEIMESYEILWKNTLGELENTVSSISFETYIAYITPVDLKGNKIVLCVPNEFYAKQIQTPNLADKIKSALINSGSGIIDFEIVVGKNREDYIKQVENTVTPEPQGSPVNPAFTFNNFVVGSSNEYIFAADRKSVV